jgi:hypothetical protein
MNEKLWEVVSGKDSKTILRSLPIRIKTKKKQVVIKINYMLPVF